jgi:hypothetical protein
MDRVTTDATDAEAAVAKVEQELSEVGGQPMREQRNQVDALKQVIADVNFKCFVLHIVRYALDNFCLQQKLATSDALIHSCTDMLFLLLRIRPRGCTVKRILFLL